MDQVGILKVAVGELQKVVAALDESEMEMATNCL